MRISKIWILLAHLLLTSCTSSSISKTDSVPALASPVTVASAEAKSPEPTPSADPVKVFSAVNYKMPVRLDSMRGILDTNAALRVLVKKIG